MAASDDIYQKLMQSHTPPPTDSEVFAQQIPGQPQQPVDNWQNPNKLEDQWLYKLGQPIYEGLTQTAPGAALLGAGEGVHQYLQSPLNLFRSPENQVGSLGTEQDINPELGGYHAGGKLTGNLLMDYLGLSGISGAMRGATGLGGLGARMGASAAHNYATGEHFPESLGGRAGAAVLGAAFPVTAGATSGEIGKSIAQAAENAEAKYGGKIGEAVAQGGPFSRVTYSNPIQTILDKGLRLSSEHGSRDAVKTFMTNPTAETAQKALSIMKAEQRAMLSHTHPKVSTLPQGSQDAYHALGDAIKDIESQMQRNMPTDVFDMFKSALKEYAGKAAPYKQPAIEGARKGTGPAKNIAKQVKQMEKYSKTLPAEEGQELINQFQYLMKQHPELYINRYAPWLAGGGLGAGLGSELWDQLMRLSGGGDEHEEHIGNY